MLILGDHFGYPGNIRHGVTSYFLNTLPALAASGVALDACFLREPHPAAEALRGQGLYPTFLNAPRWDLLVALRVAALARRRGATIIHAAGIKATLIARIAARLTGARVVIQAHDLLRPGFAVGRLHRLFARSADTGVGVSTAVRDNVVAAYHVRPSQARIIHNGVPQSERPLSGTRARVRRALGISPQADVIAMIARMHPIKGHRIMLRIMARVAAACPRAVLLLAGDGPERAACERLAAELGLEDRVRFLGSREDVPDLLEASDLVVSPSESEGLPTVAIEACAAGRPVIGFDSGGLRDIITDGKSGFLVEQGDERGFAAAVTALLSDRDRLRAFGDAAREEAARFTLDRHVRQLIDCYRDAASGPAPARKGS